MRYRPTYLAKYRFKSSHPMTPYAPSYDYLLTQSVWDEPDKVDIIRNFLLSKEKEILKLDYNNNAGTGLDSSSVSTRHGNYNVFDFVDECPELQDLLEFIKECYWNYIEQDNTQDFALKINSWFNVLYKGQKMTYHNHNPRQSAYLSGNIHLDDYHTKTNYSYMIDRLSVDNIKGGVVLFPSVVFHGTDVYNGEKPRVSIACELEVTFIHDWGDAKMINFID